MRPIGSAIPLLLVLASPGGLVAGQGVWTGHGPFLAMFGFIETSAAEPNIVYAGNQFVLMKSTDYGLRWHALTCPPFAGCPQMLKTHPRNSEIAYSVADEVTLYRTNDGGRTWRALNSAVFRGSIGDLEIDAHHPSVLYAAQKGWTFKETEPARVYRSTDGGGTWKEIFRCGSCLEGSSAEIEIDPVRPNRLYAVFDEWFFRTTDSGRTWTGKRSIARDAISGLTVDPANGNHMFVMSRQAVWRSVDGGLTWRETTNKCVGDIAIDSRATQVIYTTGRRIETYRPCTMKSTNGGQSWEDLPIPHQSTLYAVDHIQVSPRHGQILYASSDLLYRTVDGGRSWRVIVNGKGAANTYYVRSGGSDIYTFTFDRLYRSQSGTGRWELLHTPAGFSIHDFRASTADTKVMAASGGYGVSSGLKEKSWIISRDGGKTWTFKKTPFRWTRQVLPHPSDVNRFLTTGYCPAVNEFCVAETTNAGETWSLRRIPGRTGAGSAWPIAAGDGLTIYAPADNQISKSTDWGKTWNSSSFGLDKTMAVGSPGVGPGYVFVPVYRRDNNARYLYRSNIGDLHFSRVSDVSSWMHGNTPFVWPHPTDPQVVFMGGSVPLIVSVDGGVTWRPASTSGLGTHTDIGDLLIIPGSTPTLWGTFLRGVFSLTGQP